MTGRVAREVTVPYAAVLEVQDKLAKVLRKYKKYEGGTSSSPAGPDTSKFRATHSGFIEPVQFGDASYFLVGAKIGANWFPNPHNIVDDYPSWKVENRKREAMLDKVGADIDKVVLPFMVATGLNRVFRGPEWKHGSNYSVYGIPYRNWMKVSRMTNLRSNLIHIASELPKGDPIRREILAAVSKERG